MFSRFIRRFPLPKESLTGACFCELTNISKTCPRETGNVNIIQRRAVLRCGLSDNSLSSNVHTFQHATFMPTEVENQFVFLSFFDNADCTQSTFQVWYSFPMAQKNGTIGPYQILRFDIWSFPSPRLIATTVAEESPSTPC